MKTRLLDQTSEQINSERDLSRTKISNQCPNGNEMNTSKKKNEYRLRLTKTTIGTAIEI